MADFGESKSNKESKQVAQRLCGDAQSLMQSPDLFLSVSGREYP